MNKVYFDTDVLIHLLIAQEPDKAATADQIYQKALATDSFFVSLLSLQEVAYVLHRLKQNPEHIEYMLMTFLVTQPISYTIEHMRRAIALAKLVGFQNISDCLHTAIAETYCSELITFNKADFKRIQRHTDLKITLL